jgi:hypothetical protein
VVNVHVGPTGDQSFLTKNVLLDEVLESGAGMLVANSMGMCLH